MQNVELYYLGKVDFHKCWQLQKELLVKRQQDEILDTLLFVEHPPTYTLGKGGKSIHMLANEDRLKEIKATFIPVDRGGDITFHGPGQLVIYPILKLKNYHLDVHAYLRKLEEVTLQTLAEYNISAGRVAGMTGVWISDAKIAAIGVRLSRWVSMHGIAINLNTDLAYFKQIIPCGISSKSVTSLAKILGAKIDEQEFAEKWKTIFQKEFCSVVKIKPKEELLCQWLKGSLNRTGLGELREF